MPTAPKQCGSALKGYGYPLFPAELQCTEGESLPIAPQQCGSALRENHYQLLRTSVAEH